MAIEFQYPPGATPLHPDDLEGLIPRHIRTQGELNEYEATNILSGELWARNTRHAPIPSPEFIRDYHSKLFGDTWVWAGDYRSRELNIGIEPYLIGPRLLDLCRDVKIQLEAGIMPIDEIAARYSHRLVFIHPFRNGNGRLSRAAADLLLVDNGAAPFTWGGHNLGQASDARERYLAALRAADGHDYAPLLEFVRS